MRKLSLFLVLFLCLSSARAYVLKEVRVVGNKNLSEALILKTAGLSAGSTVDSGGLSKSITRLMMSDCFDTVFALKQVEGDTLALQLFVQEKMKNEVSVYSGTLSMEMFGANKFWFAVTPGYKRRFLGDRMNSLMLTATFPYSYGLSADYDAYQFPFRTFRSGLYTSVRILPYYYTPFYAQTAFLQAFTEKELFRRFFLRFSLGEEISTTWRINAERWEKLDWQIVFDPDRVRDQRYDSVYPRREQAPSLALSARLDRRNSTMVPTSGFLAYGEGQRTWVQDLKDGNVYAFNQVSGGIKNYFPVTGRQIFSTHISSVVRDRFDATHLAHRMIAYDDDFHFRGFTAISFTNILYVNMEYRFRLFGFRYEDFGEELGLSPKMGKIAKRLEYLAELFCYADNGVLWGDVFTDRYIRKSFFELNLKNDLFTGAGVGGRLAYPRLGYVATGGLTLYHRKAGLDRAYRPLIYTSLTGSF